MAIVWGSWSSNDRLRAGLELSMSPSSVGSGTASVTITTKLWMQTRYASNESGTNITPWSVSGSDSGSGYANGWNLGAMGTKLIATLTQTVNTSYSNSITFSVSGGYTSTYAYPGTHPTVSASIVIPKRPNATPSAPSGVSATRNSDTQATVNWTRNASSGAPVTSITVQQRVYTGSSWSGWSTVSSPSGSWTTNGAMSYTATGLSANRKYQWQVRANNTAGSSGFVATGEVYMTPGAPSSVTSTKDPSGTTITTTWVPTAYTSGTITHQIERSVNGGAYASVVTGIAQGTNTWTDPTPGAGSNRYKVYAKTSTGNLVSAGTEGNTVSTIVAPLAPTGLSPNGIAVDLDNTNVVLTWVHHDGGDGAAQSHYTIEYSSNGGSTYSTLSGANNVASVNSTHTITAGTLTNGTTYLWRVKTEGIVSGGFGPASASATFTGSALPVVTIDPNYPPAALNTTPIEVRWTYAQDQASPQVEWEADLLNANETIVLEHQTGSGATDAVQFAYPPVTGTTYHVRVRTRSGAGLWGSWVTASTDFDLLPPAAVTLTATFDPCAGQMVLSLDPAAPEDGVTVAADYAKVERRIDGSDWVVLAQSVAIPTDLTDPIPLTNGVNEYRVTSISGSPSYFLNDIVTATGTDGSPGSRCWVMLSYGDGFQKTLRFQGDPKTGSSNDRERVAQKFLGRRKPLLLLGEAEAYVVSASGSLRFDSTCPVTDLTGCTYDSSVREWEIAGRTAGIVCYRDYTGRRIFGMVSSIDPKDEQWPGYGSLSFTVTETDYIEGYIGVSV